jgi:hypothetical protein
MTLLSSTSRTQSYLHPLLGGGEGIDTFPHTPLQGKDPIFLGRQNQLSLQDLDVWSG